jgi:hypothetical protein
MDHTSDEGEWEDFRRAFALGCCDAQVVAAEGLRLAGSDDHAWIGPRRTI